MGTPGLRKINRYSEHFKAIAVRLTEIEGVLIQDVATSLNIHPFMLSRWRKEMREGKIVTKRVKADIQVTAELKQLRELQRRYDQLKEEHTLLKKAIRFASARRQRSLRSSKQTGKNTKSR